MVIWIILHYNILMNEINLLMFIDDLYSDWLDRKIWI
ncbi:hypothetical protein RSAG8_05440, partial [Rhizoctonia solani AG-8 WAC10335]